jgi:hypothetical protein
MVGEPGRVSVMEPTPITEAELATLESAKTDTEWNNACEVIKAARDGEFPSDWYERVMQAGVLIRFVARYGDSTGTPIKVV